MSEWIWGRVAAWALRRHYSREVRPYAEAKGYGREEIRSAAHRRLDMHFDAAWPRSPAAAFDRGDG